MLVLNEGVSGEGYFMMSILLSTPHILLLRHMDRFPRLLHQHNHMVSQIGKKSNHQVWIGD
jgi:hypothetical protein